MTDPDMIRAVQSEEMRDSATALGAPTKAFSSKPMLDFGSPSDRLPPTPNSRAGESEASTEAGSDVGGTVSDEDARAGDEEAFAHKLQFSVEETLILFDWDDTLFPTTWIQQQGLMPRRGSAPSREQKRLLKQLGEAAAITLQAAKRLGRVVIVTNAESGWIDLSQRQRLPSLGHALEGVSCVSARSAYEPLGIKSPFEWKRLAFDQEVKSYFGEPSTNAFWNVLSLGDSLHEQEALHTITRDVITCHAKSIKFADRPDIGSLISQHQLLSGRLLNIVNFDGDLDIPAMEAISADCQTE